MLSGMHYWREDYFGDLKAAATAAAANGWVEYSQYCANQERGLRSNAFVGLAKFIETLESTSFAERRRFLSWILSFAEDRKGRHLLIPYPLQKQVIEPTLLEWEAAEPCSSEPHRWLGGRQHLERALELEPGDQVALKRLIIEYLRWIDYATHELPAGYLGSIPEDLDILARVEALLPTLRDEASRLAYGEAVKEERTAITTYWTHLARKD
jgi:hypothetical protein